MKNKKYLFILFFLVLISLLILFILNRNNYYATSSEGNFYPSDVIIKPVPGQTDTEHINDLINSSNGLNVSEYYWSTLVTPDIKYFELGNTYLDLLTPEDNFERIVDSPRKSRHNQLIAVIFDYHDKGRSLSYQRPINSEQYVIFDLLIDNPERNRLRHKVDIGTDKSNWELIKKETNYPLDKPFKRIYLLVQKRGEDGIMEGLIYYEGAIITLRIKGLVNEDTILGLQETTWEVADRLENIHDRLISPLIKEVSIFQNNPTLTRPDLPDPDLI